MCAEKFIKYSSRYNFISKHFWNRNKKQSNKVFFGLYCSKTGKWKPKIRQKGASWDYFPETVQGKQSKLLKNIESFKITVVFSSEVEVDWKLRISSKPATKFLWVYAFLSKRNKTYPHKNTSKWFLFFPVHDNPLRFNSSIFFFTRSKGRLFPVFVKNH